MSDGSSDVVVVGGINTDYVGRAETLPRAGETRTGERFFERPGGKGANQAVAAARFGVRVALIGAVGNDDRGRALLAHLRDQRVNVDHVSSSSSSVTGVALIHLDSRGEKQILAILGANRNLDRASVAGAANDHEQWLPRIDVRTVDATGAGDAFIGTLAAALAKNITMQEAATLANAAAALETTEVGAQSPTVSEAQLRALARRAD